MHYFVELGQNFLLLLETVSAGVYKRSFQETALQKFHVDKSGSKTRMSMTQQELGHRTFHYISPTKELGITICYI